MRGSEAEENLEREIGSNKCLAVRKGTRQMERRGREEREERGIHAEGRPYTERLEVRDRGVQYAYNMMHKGIMVKIGESKNRKLGKKHAN